ncbi:hypothetical protein BJ170DRAFT_679743 [Xylariales sp. AK1849]|nr:hypothetical protein BJ170DRAFT_679743 [Xylariales sp. AK1849]
MLKRGADAKVTYTFKEDAKKDLGSGSDDNLGSPKESAPDVSPSLSTASSNEDFDDIQNDLAVDDEAPYGEQHHPGNVIRSPATWNPLRRALHPPFKSSRNAYENVVLLLLSHTQLGNRRAPPAELFVAAAAGVTKVVNALLEPKLALPLESPVRQLWSQAMDSLLTAACAGHRDGNGELIQYLADIGIRHFSSKRVVDDAMDYAVQRSLTKNAIALWRACRDDVIQGWWWSDQLIMTALMEDRLIAITKFIFNLGKKNNATVTDARHLMWQEDVLAWSLHVRQNQPMYSTQTIIWLVRNGCAFNKYDMRDAILHGQMYLIDALCHAGHLPDYLHVGKECVFEYAVLQRKWSVLYKLLCRGADPKWLSSKARKSLCASYYMLFRTAYDSLSTFHFTRGMLDRKYFGSYAFKNGLSYTSAELYTFETKNRFLRGRGRWYSTVLTPDVMSGIARVNTREIELYRRKAALELCLSAFEDEHVPISI